MIERLTLTCPPPGKIEYRPVSEKVVQQSLESLYDQAARFSRDKRLGILGRARFARALQEVMREQGYPANLVSQVVSAVTVNALVAPTERK